jgi:hypothetical protein
MPVQTGRHSLALELPVAANDNDDVGKHTLPALQRAARGDLMTPGESDEQATITLGRLVRIFRGEAVLEVEHLGFGVEDTPRACDEDGEPVPPSCDSRLRDLIPFDEDDPDSLKEMLTVPMRVIRRHYWHKSRKEPVTLAYPQVFLNGRWQSYEDSFGEAKKSTKLPPGYRIRQPQIQTTRQELADMDDFDRRLLKDLMGADALDTVEQFVAGANMEAIGAAAGFRGKQAEAVGLDRIRTAVRRAQWAFREIEAARKADYSWMSPPAVARQYPHMRRAA